MRSQKSVNTSELLKPLHLKKTREVHFTFLFLMNRYEKDKFSLLCSKMQLPTTAAEQDDDA